MLKNNRETDHALHHVQHVGQMLETVISHVHGDLGKLSDPKAIALFQSAADVLLKLKAGFDEFEDGWNATANPEAQTRPADWPPLTRESPIRSPEMQAGAGKSPSPWMATPRPTGQYVIQRASESRNEFWTGNGWSENEPDAQRYTVEPDAAEVSGDESAVAALIWDSQFGKQHS